tara:strand:- start:755 stop:1720 length:966 start_codon:yes stop_codon:yes gene_type:complete
MNNYSWLQKRLHQFALSAQFMREATYDIESFLISPIQETNNHVFIAGLARSGTSILLNALYESNQFSSLLYKDMPFILAPNLWSRVSFGKKNLDLVERAHGDGIKISINSPEAFEEVFWMTFNDDKNESNKKFIKYVQLINHKYKKDRYLSKNNQNIRRVKLLSKIFPHSKILIPYRNPLQHAFSLLSQHKRFIKNAKIDKFIANYMELIGHKEFGPNYKPLFSNKIKFIDDLDINHWIEQWYLTYKKCYESLENKNNICFICYEELCKSHEYWLSILKLLDIKEKYNFSFKESHKEIGVDYDSKLTDKAFSIYNKLSQST